MPRQRPKQKKKPKRSREKAPPSARRRSRGPRGGSAELGRERIGKLFEGLVAVQARLRAPGGCPWDREQTHHTLRTFLIEEAYEVLDAIQTGNARELAEELGDLLLQVLFHSDLAREAGQFDISDVVTGIHDKLIRRHPHVFGDVKAETAGEVLKNWARLKAEEKESSFAQASNSRQRAPSELDGVPRSLPALLEAYQMTRRAAQVGFDWERVEGILEKLREEIAELKLVLESSDRSSIEEEVGDILFCAMNLARFLGLDPEVALKSSNLKFKQRFQDMEWKASLEGKALRQLSKDELERLWEAAKANENSQAPSVTKP